MITKVPLPLKQNSYMIYIGNSILDKLPAYVKALGLGTDAVIVSHPMIERLHGVKLAAALRKAGYSVRIFNVPEGEPSKSAVQALRLIEQIAAYDVGRKIFLLALGGGVIGDLAGFVSAVYKRGVPYIQVPTSLLAQIDSAIGGKTGIDLRYGKNLVGAFYQPRLVFSDTRTLKTLSRRQIQNGLAEAVKYGVIADAGLFSYLENNYARFLKLEPAVLNHVVECCSRIKAKVVAADERDILGIRAILNFGHTAGHAIEAASRYGRYQHGEAVALGMRVAADISVALKLFKVGDADRLNRLLDNIGLPGKIEGMKLKSILDLMRHDKKFIGSRNRFVLALKIGQVKLVEGVPAETIAAAIRKYME